MTAPSDAGGALAGVRLERAAILRLIPQQGAMCLLEAILDWDTERLLAQGADANAPGHPLRAHGRLGSALALEYAAQAAAAHGALLGALSSAGGASCTALLASARAVQLQTLRLDARPEPLRVEVRRVHAQGGGALYDFSLEAGAPLARGRLSLLAA